MSGRSGTEFGDSEANERIRLSELDLGILQGLVDGLDSQGIADRTKYLLGAVKNRRWILRHRFENEPGDEGLLKAVVYALNNGLVNADSLGEVVPDRLNNRKQQEMLELLSKGISPDQMVGRLGLLPATVKSYLLFIYAVYDIHSLYRLAAAVLVTARRGDCSRQGA